MKQENPAARLESPAFRRGEEVNDTRTVLAELDSKLTKSAAALDVYARAETRAYPTEEL